MIENKNICFIDIETRSHIDLTLQGAWVYSKHESTDVLCISYKFKGRKTQTWVPGKPVPKKIQDFEGFYVSHNALFEYSNFVNYIIDRYDWPKRMEDTNNWLCTMAMSRRAGLPGTLERVAHILNLEKGKLDIGKDLIRKFSKPKKTKEGLSFNEPTKDDMREMIRYCERDTEITEKIYNILDKLPNNKIEKEIFALDFRQNVSGIPIDIDTLKLMIERLKAAKEKAENNMNKYGINVRSNKQLSEWLEKRGVILENLQGDTINRYLNSCKDKEVREVLNLRVLLSRSSVKKFDTLYERLDFSDNKLRLFLQYYGALTGRWAGRGVQPHNLPKTGTKPKELEQIILAFKNNKISFSDTMVNAKKVLPGLIKATKGMVFIIGDFAAIEARCLAYIAGQTDLAEKFKNNEDIYREMAAVIYNKSIKNITDKDRQLGKIVILGSGYGLGWRGLVYVCKSWGIDITEDLAKDAIYTYRERFTAITDFWKDLENAFYDALTYNKKIFKVGKFIKIQRNGTYISITLPNKRVLYYHQVKDHPRDGLSYLNHIKQYRSKLYGGLITENVIQAICRDILADRMLELDKAGLNPILHVHDEAINMVPEKTVEKDQKKFDEIMNTAPDWLPGFPLKTESEISYRYFK